MDTLAAPTPMRIPLGGVTRVDSLPDEAPLPSDTVRVMPGPGFGEYAQVKPDSVAVVPVVPVPPVAQVEEMEVIIGQGISRIDPLRATPAYLLKPGEWEAKWYNQVYTQTAYYDGSGAAIDQGARSTYYSGIFSAMFGSRTRLNFGLEAWMQSVRLDAKDSGPFRVLWFERIPGSRTALTFVGPKLRIPLTQRMSLQSSFLIPTAKDPEGRAPGRPYLASENFLWWSQLTYQAELGQRFQLYAQVDPYWNINRKEGNGFLALPASAFLTYLPHHKFSLFGNTQFWPQLGSGGFSAWWLQVGGGAKYALTHRLTLELAYGRFVAGRNSAGPADAYNFGIRYIHW